jgi:hypothetical protein
MAAYHNTTYSVSLAVTVTAATPAAAAAPATTAHAIQPPVLPVLVV